MITSVVHFAPELCDLLSGQADTSLKCAQVQRPYQDIVYHACPSVSPSCVHKI